MYLCIPRVCKTYVDSNINTKAGGVCRVGTPPNADTGHALVFGEATEPKARTEQVDGRGTHLVMIFTKVLALGVMRFCRPSESRPHVMLIIYCG